jgi:hypothetical protein
MWSAEPQLRHVRAATLGHYHQLLVGPGGIRRWLDTHILGEVAGLVALAALDAFSRARLGALLGVVAFLLAVLAGVRIDALLRAVAGAVADLLAVDASDLRRSLLTLGLFLLAVLLICKPEVLRRM